MPLPNRDEELGVLRAHHAGFDPRDLGAAGVRPVAGAADLAAARAAVAGCTVAERSSAYIVDLCRATRAAPSLELGASPRGATGLLGAARRWPGWPAADYVTPDDVKAVARPTLRHRVRLRPEAELEGVTADAVLDSVLATVPTPRCHLAGCRSCCSVGVPTLAFWPGPLVRRVAVLAGAVLLLTAAGLGARRARCTGSLRRPRRRPRSGWATARPSRCA